MDYLRDVVLIAGNVGETLDAVKLGLGLLRKKFRRVRKPRRELGAAALISVSIASAF